MATEKPGTAKGKQRRLIDAVDDLRREIRTATLVAVLAAPSSVVEHDDGKRAKTPSAVARVDYKNKLRAEIRAELGIAEVTGDGD